MKLIFSFVLLLVFFSSQAQQSEKFNLGFETQTDKNELADGWHKWGDYELSIENLSHSGQRAGVITSDESGSSFGSIAYKIPAHYKGKSIQLKGFMKTQDVEEGFAGLLLRIDANGEVLAFDNMVRQKIKGTTDWQEYNITLDYTEEADNIFVAGILVGKGKVWFDDFVLSIDGESIQNLKEDKELFKAQLDHEFDDGSLIAINDLSVKKIENLELLGKVWGFLKYHHPEIGKGNYNWDYELFRHLAAYLELEEDKERDQFIINWIDSLGKVKQHTECEAVAKDAFLKPELEWIDQQSASLKEKLMSIYTNRHQAKHYYVNVSSEIKNPKFQYENSYSKMPYPDDGFRLLAVYRYWNMIQYFFPYKHLTDKDWSLVLKEYIPKFLNAKDELAYEFAALELIGEIKDTHGNLWRGADRIKEWKGDNFSPVHLRFIENQLVVTDFYNPELKEETDLEIGDVITTINGKSITQIIEEKSKYYPASNQPTRLRDLTADLLRSNKNEISLSYTRKNEKMHKQLKLYPYDSLNVYRWYRRNNNKSYKLLDNNIGYVTLASIKDEDVPLIKEQFMQTKGIIIDIRNYPSTFVPFTLGSYFMSESRPFVKFTKGSTVNPGEFRFGDELIIDHEEKAYKGKLIVIVNEITQSSAEYTAMAFRAGDNTTVIGSTTAGADGNVSTIYLPGGLRTLISGIGIYYPNGEETQRVGIVPDIEVKPTIKGIRNGKDELLEKAIELILQE